MRKHEVYSIDCVGCGRTIESETTQFPCTFCGLLIRLEWGGTPQPAATTAPAQRKQDARNHEKDPHQIAR
jgi:hypothetical protein